MRNILRNSTPKKVSKKRWTKYEQTFKKQMRKKKMTFWAKSRETREAPGGPSAQQNTTKSTRHIHTSHKKPHASFKGTFKGSLQRVTSEGEWRRWVKKVSEKGECRKGESKHLTRLGRLQARSGYIWTTSPPGFPGYPAGNWALEYPDSWPSHPLNLRAPIPDFQIHFSSFRVLFSALFDFRLLSDLIFQLPSSIFFLFWELVGSILG